MLPAALDPDSRILLQQNPVKRREIERYGVEISERLPLVVEPNDENLRYLQTEESKMGHRLGLGKGWRLMQVRELNGSPNGAGAAILTVRALERLGDSV